MARGQMQSVGDVAHLLEVHEQVVLEWAERNELPRVGREFVFSAREVREFERWLKAAGVPEDERADGDDDGADPDDGEDGEAADDEDGDGADDEDGDDDDDDGDDGDDGDDEDG